MSKVLTLILLLAISNFAQAQLTIEDSELNNLVKLSEYYSKNSMLSKPTAMEDLEGFRTEKLDNIINNLQCQTKPSQAILDHKYMSRPSHEDLILWYVIRKIHRNFHDKENTPKESIDIAKEVLGKKIDERLLVDNYYSYLYGALAMLFNTTDLSMINIDLNQYGLKSDTEKAIVYLNLIDALAMRFTIVRVFNNNDKLFEMAERMPTFNGKQYYYYTNFQYSDFEWTELNIEERWFNERYIKLYYDILMSHFGAELEEKHTENIKDMYLNSILSKPEYFKYSTEKSSLKKIDKRFKKMLKK